MLTVNNIIVKDSVAILEKITKTEEITLLYKYAIENNIPYYLAIATDGKKYAATNETGGYRVLKVDEEYAKNPKYQPPVIAEPVNEKSLFEFQSEESVKIEELIPDPKEDTTGLKSDVSIDKEIELLRKELAEKNDIILQLTEEKSCLESYKMATEEVVTSLENQIEDLKLKNKELEKGQVLTLEKIVCYVRNAGYELKIK